MIEFPKLTDDRGCLTFIEAGRHVPFPIKRVFYLYDVPSGASRGAHAHKELHQVLICLFGSFDVLIKDGIRERCIHLNQPSMGLYIPPLIWDTEVNFQLGSVCMVVASEHYNEADYYREYIPYVEAVTTARMKWHMMRSQS